MAVDQMETRSPDVPKWLPWVAVGLVILFTAIVRLRLLNIPLERDEGEYAYAGQLMLQGIPPYKLAFNMKFPGVYASYALIMALFGQTTSGIHFGFLLLNAGTIVLVYFLGKRLSGVSGGVAACAAWAILSIGAGVMGTQAHATHFVVAAAVGATLLLLRGLDRGQPALFLWSGCLYAVAVLMKQHGVLFGVFGGFFLIVDHLAGWSSRRLSLTRKLAPFCGGVLLTLGFTAMVLWRAGVFGQFWFWTITYASAYVVEAPLHDGIIFFRTNFQRLAIPDVAIWITAAVGLVLVWFKGEARRPAIFSTLFLVFSFAAVCPGLWFREHYFVLMLPAVALLAGAAVSVLSRWLPGRLTLAPASLFALALAVSIYQQREFLFHLTPLQASRMIYGTNPFPEAVQVADYIRAHSDKSAQIGVLGSEPEIPFYAGRRSATGDIYMYGLMEPQPFAMKMQLDVIHDFEQSRPEYMVFVSIPMSWGRNQRSAGLIFDWWRVYQQGHYKLVGIVDIKSESRTEYHWIEDGEGKLESWRPSSPWVVSVFRRAEQASSPAPASNR